MTWKIDSMMASASRVFMIGWEYPPHNSGGLGVACEGLTEALSQVGSKIFFTLPYLHQTALGHMQIVSCIDPSWAKNRQGVISEPPFGVYESYSSEEKKVFSSGSLFSMNVLRSLPQSELENKVHQYAQVVAQQGEVLQEEYDIIHAHDWMSFPAALRLRQKVAKPFIAHIHSTEFDRIPTGYGSQYIMKTEYEGMQYADRVIAVSHYTKKMLVDKYGIDASKIDVVHNGIHPLSIPPDPGSHHFAHKRPTIVFMGRLTMQKGADYFLLLAQRVLNEVPHALFIVAGSGDMYHELLIKNSQHGLSASVVFSGFVRDVQREKLLDRADVFVMPSVSEPFGLVALEAAQRHTPVIVSSNAGVSEVMPGSIVVDFWDLNAMSTQIVKILHDEGHAKQVVASQLQNVQETTWQKAASKVRGVYSRFTTA